MNAAMAHNAYKRSEENSTISPVKLVHLMFERSIAHLREADEAIQEKDPVKRGENLSKAIAIITELYLAVPAGQENEAAVFLRSLYNSILVELPKVSAFGDREVLAQTLRYMEKLKEIWENNVLPEFEAYCNAPSDREANDKSLPRNPPKEPIGISFSI